MRILIFFLLLSSRKEQERELQNKIIALEQDLKETQFIIDEIEKKITENNLRMEKLKTFRRSQNNSLIDDQRTNEPSQAPTRSNLPVIEERLKYKESQLSAVSETSVQESRRSRKKDQKVSNPGECAIEKCTVF